MSGPVTQHMIEAYAAGELDPADQARVEQHLLASPTDAATARRLQAVVRTLRTDADAPSRARVDAAIRLFRPRSPSLLEQVLGSLQATLAALVHDSRAAPALAGFRSVQEVVEVAYSADSAEVEMRCEPVVAAGVEKWHIVGQVTLADGVSGDAVLQFAAADDGAERVEVQVDDAGMFSADLKGGCYDVVLIIGGRAVVIPELEL